MSHDLNRPGRRDRRKMDREARIRFLSYEMFIKESGLSHEWSLKSEEFREKARAQFALQRAAEKEAVAQ